MPDEAELHGELLTAVRRGAGGLRAEAILEKLLQQVGATRAGLVAEAGEVRVLRKRLAELQQEHMGCDGGRRLLQEQVAELQHQLVVSKRSLSEVSADRDMFLRRLQQLESESEAGSGPGRPPSRLELQRQKAHAQQLHMLEGELNALASSNQQLRSQLELASAQLSKANKEKLAAQEVSGNAADRAAALQQELDVLKSAADIEVAIRKEMEMTIHQASR
eukprot:gene6386-6618_t